MSLDRLILDAIRICSRIKVQVLILTQKRGNLSLQLFPHLSVYIDVLDREGDYGATNLDSHRVVFGQAQCVLEQDDRAKFRKVVFDVETVFAALDDRVAA